MPTAFLTCRASPELSEEAGLTDGNRDAGCNRARKGRSERDTEDAEWTGLVTSWKRGRKTPRGREAARGART